MRIAIIGAGAAGCFAAANIPDADEVEVTVFEKTGKALQKVKASGGGRCNVTHYLFDIPELTGRYPRGKQFLRQSLFRFGPQQTKDWFEQRGVPIKAEGDGRMFPVTDQSQTIIDCIWQEMMQKNVRVLFNKSVERIEKTGELFHLFFTDKTSDTADRVLVSCGGFPKEEQFRWLTQLGHSIKPPVPSLFTFNLPGHPITSLMGVAVPFATVKVTGTKIMEQGPVLITHWGLSGPAILRASAWGARELHELNYRFKAQINWLGAMKEDELKQQFVQQRKEQGKQLLQQRNPFELPRRLWDFLLTESGIKEETRWGDLAAASQNRLIEHLLRHTFPVSGKTTYKEEFVTGGGISLQEIDPRTMESRLVPGLYFAGEIMDVDGITGGFNFQHAWASGWVAATEMVREKVSIK